MWVTVLFFSINVFAEDSAEVKCFEKKIVEECEVQAQLIHEQTPEQLKKRYQYSFQACLLKNKQGCSDSINVAEKIDKETLFKTEQKVQEFCNQDEEMCDLVAHVFEEKGKHKEALAYALKTWLKFGDGPYATLEYKYGNKKKAYKAMLEACEKNHESCQFTFRYYPAHPQRKKIIENAEKACRNESETGGASVCIDLGIYYFDHNEKSKGLEFLDLNCNKNNPTACEVLIGMEDTFEKKDQAFKKFCSALKLGNVIPFSSINKFCDDEKSQKINDEIIQSSKKMIDSWRQEIKSK